MNIAVLSDSRLPTGPDGHHGLGRSCYDLARGLALRGHAVTLYGAEGSTFEHGALVVFEEKSAFELPDADAILDGTHEHKLSQRHPDAPIVNRIGDTECMTQPPNIVVATQDMQKRHPAARIVPTGINAAEIPFYPNGRGYLVFMGAQYPRKGFPGVLTIAEKAGVTLKVGANLTGRAKWDFLGYGLALLHPSILDAAPRLPLEAAACGVPTLCLDITGTPEHVGHCISGFVCRNEDEIADAVPDALLLDRQKCRQWVEDTHGYKSMIDGYEAALQGVADGERW